jgi:hypothetical protein
MSSQNQFGHKQIYIHYIHRQLIVLDTAKHSTKAYENQWWIIPGTQFLEQLNET